MTAPDRVPAPTPTIKTDPSTLTTAALLREIENLKQAFRIEVDAAQQIIETRLAGMDKANVLLQAFADKTPALIKGEVDQLEMRHNEKFSSIQTQFTERDVRTEQTSKDSKVAIDAALQAQKEAAIKSEAAFTKQIDQMVLLISTMGKGLDEKIDDVKTRLQAIEGIKRGSQEVWGYLVAVAGLAIAAFSIFWNRMTIAP